MAMWLGKKGEVTLRRMRVERSSSYSWTLSAAVDRDETFFCSFATSSNGRPQEARNLLMNSLQHSLPLNVTSFSSMVSSFSASLFAPCRVAHSTSQTSRSQGWSACSGSLWHSWCPHTAFATLTSVHYEVVQLRPACHGICVGVEPVGYHSHQHCEVTLVATLIAFDQWGKENGAFSFARPSLVSTVTSILNLFQWFK